MKKLIFAFFILSSSAYADSYAFVDNSGNVTNVVEWDGKSDYRPCPDKTNNCLVKDTNSPPEVARGWTYEAPTLGIGSGTFYPPENSGQ